MGSATWRVYGISLFASVESVWCDLGRLYRLSVFASAEGVLNSVVRFDDVYTEYRYFPVWRGPLIGWYDSAYILVPNIGICQLGGCAYLGGTWRIHGMNIGVFRRKEFA